MTQIDLSAATCISPSDISAWEKGYSTPKVAHQIKLAKVLDCEIQDLGFEARSESVFSEDALTAQRFKRPEDLNTEGCLALIQAILEEAAADYMTTKRAVVRSSADIALRGHLKNIEDFFLCDYFCRLTGLDGHSILEGLEQQFRASQRQRRRKVGIP